MKKKPLIGINCKIITDGGDCTNAEWEFGKGLVFPPRKGVK